MVQWYIIARTQPDLLSQRCLFHATLEYEWLYNSNLSLDPEELNPRLTEWLIEYNFNRPHQSLGYLAPIEHVGKELAKICCPVLPYPCGQPGHPLDKVLEVC